MRSNKLIFLTTVLAVAFLSLPVIAGADTVPWSSGQYTAIARSDGFGTDTQYGPPLPITASKASTIGSINETSSTITGSDMIISGYLDMWSEVGASAEFSGTYTATSTNPLFIFTYSLTSVSYNTAADSYWLYVNDLTDGVSLYNSALSFSDTPISIIVSTTPGNEISVDFGVSADVAGHLGPASFDTTLAYSTAVAPEPISSILFVAGGTLLAGRRYFRRNRRA